MKIAVTAMLLTASLAGITTPATAHADEPVPTVDQVMAVVNELIDSDIPAANKSDIVTPGFTPKKPKKSTIICTTWMHAGSRR